MLGPRYSICEVGVGCGLLCLYDVVDVCFCNVVHDDIVSCDGGRMVKGDVVIVVAFDPDPFD